MSRVSIEYTYLEENYTTELRDIINAYYDAGDVVIIWFKYVWPDQALKPTTDQFNEAIAFIEDNNIKNTGLLTNFDENYLNPDLLLAADIYIPER